MLPAPQEIPPDAALVIVDVQVGFCPGGNLAVPEGDEVVPVANAWIERFQRAGLPIVLTRDWHPPDHCSFKEQGGPWPVHCVRDSEDAAFHPDLEIPRLATIVSKALEPEQEEYGAFDRGDLAAHLRRLGVRRLSVMGLATDYCVRATTLGALDAGFDVAVVRDGVRAVNVKPDDGARALREMAEAGAHLV